MPRRRAFETLRRTLGLSVGPRSSLPVVRHNILFTLSIVHTVAPKPAASSNRVYAGRQATDYSALVERAARAERAWGTKSARSQGASSGVRAAQSEAMAIRAAEEAPHRDMDTRGRSNSYGHTPPGETLHVVC